jgi:hypothetical protein
MNVIFLMLFWVDWITAPSAFPQHPPQAVYYNSDARRVGGYHYYRSTIGGDSLFLTETWGTPLTLPRARVYLNIR